MEQEGGSSFGPNFWCHNSVLEQEGAKEGVHKAGAKNLHKTVEIGVKIRDQTLGQNQPISVHFQGNFLTLISFIFMLKFEANLSVFPVNGCMSISSIFGAQLLGFRLL